MKSASFEFKKKLAEGALLYPYAVITLSDGTKLTLDENDFMGNGNSITEGSGESKFPLGCAVAKTITISLDNSDDRYSGYDFYYARTRLSTRMKLDSGGYESVNEGYFTVIDPETPGKTIVIDAVDDMYKADVDYIPGISYPATLSLVANDVAARSNLIVNPIFKNSDYIVREAPTGLTCRAMFGLIAQIAGGNAVCNANGIVTIKTYNTSAFESVVIVNGGANGESVPDIIDGGISVESIANAIDAGASVPPGTHNLFNLFDPRIGTDDIVITGISTVVEKDGEEEILVGLEGYTLKIDNPLIKGNESDALNRIATVLIGLTLRPFTTDHAAYCIAEFMDPCYVWDADRNVYQTYITDIDFPYFDKTSFKNSSQSPLRNKSSYFSNATEAYRKAREGAEKQRGAWEKAIEDLSNRLNDATGLHTTIEKQTDGSFIFYLHDKETVEESQIIWKMTAEAWGVSTDGGNTWNGGMTVDGDTIVRILSAVGINADWINAGSILADFIKGGKLTIGGFNNANGLIEVLTSSGDTGGWWGNTGIVLRGNESNAIFVISNNDSWTQLTRSGLIISDTKSSTNQYVAVSNNPGEKCYIMVVDANGTAMIETAKQIFEGETTVGALYCRGDANFSTTFTVSSTNVAALKKMLVFGDFSVINGTKSRVADTENYAKKMLYCYEMPAPMFGDIGEAIIDDDGNCYIFLDDIFSETVNTDCEYQVFLQKEEAGDLWVDSKESAFFVVKGTPNLKFAWEIKAKQRNFEFERLETFDEDDKPQEEADYESQAAQMVKSYYEELEEMFDEESN